MKIRTKLHLNTFLIAVIAFGIAIVAAVSAAQGTYRIIDSVLIIFTLVIGLVAFIIGHFLSSSITASLNSLRRGVQEISKGNLNFRTPVAGRDELSQLASVFNDMVARLQTSYSNLERDVAQRTRELTVDKMQLAQDKAKDDAILGNIGDGIVATTDGGEITLVNHSTELLTGWSASELIGKRLVHVLKLFNKEGLEIPVEKRPLRLALLRREKIINSKNFYLHKDGHRFPVSITATPIIFNNQVIGGVNVFRDITREWEIDRMKTEFISLASHQLRTPLAAMKWFSEILLSGDSGKLSAEQADLIHNIAQSNERMIDLVNTLLNISRIESGRIIIEPVPTDLARLINELLIEIRNRLDEKKLKFVVSVHAGLEKIPLDPKLIRHVYLNLLTNAIKYTPENGEISVFVSRKADQVISQVTDNGYGIKRADQPKIFQKFYRAANTAKRVPEGVGLGLYLAKIITESSGGKIWFQSREGQGTTFWFSLPVAGVAPQKGEVTLDS